MTNNGGEMDIWLLEDHGAVTEGMTLLFNLIASWGGNYLVAKKDDKIYLLDSTYYTYDDANGKGADAPQYYLLDQNLIWRDLLGGKIRNENKMSELGENDLKSLEDAFLTNGLGCKKFDKIIEEKRGRSGGCNITAKSYKNVFSTCISQLKGSYSNFFSTYYGYDTDIYNNKEKELIKNADRSLESWIKRKINEISVMDNEQARKGYDNFKAVMECVGMMYLNKQCLSPRDKISIEYLAKDASLRSSIASRNDSINMMCSNMLINTLRLKPDYDVIKSRDDFFRQMTESIKGVNRFKLQQLINNIFSYCTKDRLEVGLGGGEKKLEYNKAKRELLITMQDNNSHGVQMRVSNLNDKPIFKYKFNVCSDKFDEVSLPKDVYPNICHNLFELCHKVEGEEYYLVIGDGNVNLQKKGIPRNIDPKVCKSTILLDLYEKLGSGKETKNLKQVAETFTQYFKNLEEDKKYKNEKRIDEFTPSKAYWGRVCRPKECNNTIAYGPTTFYSVHLNNKNKPRRCY